MKKLLLNTTLLLLCSIFSLSAFSQVDIQNFRITSPTNETFTAFAGQRFHYEFDIRGEYGYNEIQLQVYVDSVTTNNRIGTIKWNREGDDYLFFNTYTKKATWNGIAHNWSGRSFKTNPLRRFYLVVEYLGSSQTYLHTIPDADSDGDGILDSQDNCPNEVGPTSNNGCPLKFPDLVATKISLRVVHKGITTATPNTLTIKEKELHEVCVDILNQGNGTTPRQFDVKVVLATGPSLATSTTQAYFTSFDTNNRLGPNQHIELCGMGYVDNPFQGYDLSSFHYMHVLVDDSNYIDEGYNENNNSMIATISSNAARGLPLIVDDPTKVNEYK